MKQNQKYNQPTPMIYNNIYSNSKEYLPIKVQNSENKDSIKLNLNANENVPKSKFNNSQQFSNVT